MPTHPQTRQSAIQRAQQLLVRQPLYLDTETTGMEADSEIVEICLIDHTGQVLLDSLVKPTRKIPYSAIRIHGIDNQMVKDAPAWPALWPTVKELLAERSVGIYNAEFDLRMMQQSHRMTGLPWQPIGSNAICLMKLYAEFYGDWDAIRRSYRWQSLERAGQQCRIALPNSHRAQADTLLAKAVLEYMAGQKA